MAFYPVKFIILLYCIYARFELPKMIMKAARQLIKGHFVHSHHNIKKQNLPNKQNWPIFAKGSQSLPKVTKTCQLTKYAKMLSKLTKND